MKNKIITTCCALGVSLGAMAQSNLILNPIFNQGNNNGVPNDWSSDANANYNYGDTTAPSYGSGGDIWSLGWVNGDAGWQNTGAAIQANSSYDLTVTAEVGQSPVTGITLSLQDVTAGWTMVDSQQFLFSTADQSDGQYETFSLLVPQSALTSIVGDTIGVGITMDENPSSQYGWVHLDSASLEAVPEPAEMGLFSMAACAAAVLIRRKK